MDDKMKNVIQKKKELEEKRESIINEINQINEALEQTFEMYAIGDIDEKDFQKAERIKNEKIEELKKIEEMIQRVKAVHRKVAAENLPIIKQARQKKINKIQDEYNSDVKEVIEARNIFLKKLAKVGQTKKKVGEANREVNRELQELGLEPERYGSAIHERTIISGGYTPNAETLGIKEAVQKQVYSTGNLPSWADGGE